MFRVGILMHCARFAEFKNVVCIVGNVFHFHEVSIFIKTNRSIPKKYFKNSFFIKIKFIKIRRLIN